MISLPLAAALLMASGGLREQQADGRQSGPTMIPSQDPGEVVRLDDVEVSGRRGAALTPPEMELDGAAIDAFGAWDIGEVLSRLEELLGADDPPLVLINGKPTPNAAVFSGFPPDALVRAEVLPANAGPLYGAAPRQRVVNLVLQRRFSSHDGRLVGIRPTQGGASSLQGDLRRSSIVERNTQQLGVSLSRDTALRAGERDGYRPDVGAGHDDVTLRPASESVGASASLTRALGEWSSAFSLNGQVTDSRSTVRLSDATVESRSSGESLSASAGMSGDLLGWALQANLTGRVARFREVGLEGRNSENQSLGLTGGLRRPLFDMSAGPVVANFNLNLQSNWSLTERGNGDVRRSVSTGDLRGGLAVPLTQRDEGFAGRLLGDLDISAAAGVRKGAGGSGQNLNAGFSWSPREKVRLSVDWSHASESVSDQQRFEPQYFGPPLVIFDFRTGSAVEILPLRGGNPDLRPPESDRLGATASFGPFTPWELSGTLGYQRAEYRDGIGALPALTSEVEAAFPDRIQRGPDGRLLSVDYRPLNLDATRTEALHTTLSFNLPRTAGAVGRDATALRVAFNHTLQLRNEVALLPGLPTLDRLDGDGGGISPQNLRVLVDARRGRWGGNLSARWQEGSLTRRIRGQDGPDDLVFSAHTAVDLRLNFQMIAPPVRVEGGAQARRNGAGLQVTLEVENLFDTRREARLGDGRIAPGHGRDVQDPMGRTVRLTLQRRF